MGIPFDKISGIKYWTGTTSATANETVPAKNVLGKDDLGAYQLKVDLMGEGVYLEGAAAGRDGINFPTAITEVLDATTVAESRTVRLTDTLYVIGLLVANTSFTAYAVTIDGTTITVGTAVHINGDTAIDTDSVGMCRISDTVFGAAYRDTGGAAYIKARCGTVTGTTIVMGTEGSVYDIASTEDELDVAYINGCLVVAFANNVDALGVVAVPTTVAGVIGTAGSIVIFEDTAPSMTAVCEMANGYVFVAYADGTDGLLDARVASVSAAGAIGTPGTVNAIAAIAPMMTKCVKVQENKVILGYIEATTSNDPYIVACTTAVGGTTITAGTPVAMGAALATDFSFDLIDNTQGVAVWCDDAHGSDLGYAIRFSIAAGTTTTITADAAVDKFTEALAKVGILKAMDCACGTDGKVVIGYSGVAGDLFAVAGSYFENRIVDVRSTAVSASYKMYTTPINDRIETQVKV